MIPGIDINNLDTSVNPADDFYRYANGGWLKNNPIPDDEFRWGTFNELNLRKDQQLHEILEELASNKDLEANSNQQKLRDFYLTGIDQAKKDAQAFSPIQPDIERIRGISNHDELLKVVSYLQRRGIEAAWLPNVEPDDKHSTVNVFRLYQGGLGLPDRDYYLKTDDESKRILAEYKKHLVAVFTLLDSDEETAEEKSKIILELETELARFSMTQVERRDPLTQYNKMTVAELVVLASNVNWPAYLEQIGLGGTKELIVSQTKFMVAINQMWQDMPLQKWQAYLEWKLLCHVSDKLHQALLDLHFNFYGKILTGAKELKPTWRRTLQMVDEGIGEALGQEYIERHFSERAKQRVYDMVNYLTEVFADRIKGLDWMEQETKQQALGKLSQFTKQIGYPDQWRDYSTLEIKPDALVLNYFRAAEFEFNRLMNQVNQPVDKSEWLMTPPTINAYYTPNFNQIVFPAGILQQPMFDLSADDAVNYGAIGSVIGHELTHGFDDVGSQFDGSGNLKQWWTEDDRKGFIGKTKLMIDQFNAYKVVDDLAVNGELTLGENIADLGGLYIAFGAFQRWQQENPSENVNNNSDSLTPEQKFFLGYAQVWRQNIHDEAQKQRLVIDPHSPGYLRVNGPLSNMAEFHAAFNIQKGDTMYRPEELRPKIW
jgi:putative endopeptidase